MENVFEIAGDFGFNVPFVPPDLWFRCPSDLALKGDIETKEGFLVLGVFLKIRLAFYDCQSIF